MFDDYAFWSAPVMPLRFRLDNGKVGQRINATETLPAELEAARKRTNFDIPIGSDNRYSIHHGAGVILKMPLNPKKHLKYIRLATLSNDIVIGLMGLTLEKL